MTLLTSNSYLAESIVGNGVTYPYRYPPLEAVLNKAPRTKFATGATALGAALTVLAAQPVDTGGGGSQEMATANASPVAYGVLNRARVGGGCAPQLDLLLLLAADDQTRTGILSTEEQRTETACPHNPTPAWVVGQSQLRMLDISLSPTDVYPTVVASLRAARTTFGQLAATYPDDTGVLTGLGDSYLRTGTYLRSSEPFTARQDFKSAIAEYNRATALGGGPEATPGVARALIGLRETATAARLLAPMATSKPFPGQILELLITADETGHDFASAVTATERLSQLGKASYPDGAALLPVPLAGSVDQLDDVTLPLSFGVGHVAPLTTELILPGGAGGSVQDLSFIPQYRDDIGMTGTQPTCPSWTLARDEMLLGRSASVLKHWPPEFESVRPGSDSCPQIDKLKLIAQTITGQPPSRAILIGEATTRDDLADGWQNLLRWAGRFSEARTFVQQWEKSRGDKSALPALRLGEIDFLQHRYNDAAADFDLAARRWRLISYNDDVDVDEAEVDRGAALLAAGRDTEAVQTLRPIELQGTEGYAYQNSSSTGDSTVALRFAAVSYYASEQLADYERESGNLHAAIEDYTNALDWVPELARGGGIVAQALNNNAALARLGLGETDAAATLENKALSTDPQDPIFLMTRGFIADRAGHIAQAASYDRKALTSDSGAFPAANDLAVELTREGHPQAAAEDLRKAVGARPSYALGWFNLGVVESKLGPAHVLLAQGAFARAYSLDPAFQDRRHDMTIDASVYRTALDLSKPLPPRWSFSQLQQPAPAAAAGLLAVVLLGLGLAKTTGRRGTVVASQWLDPVSTRLESLPLLRKLTHPGWALAATAASFLFAYLRKGTSGSDMFAYTVGVVILSLIAAGSRVIVARRREIKITQQSWPAGLVFGLLAGAAGLPWAPLPVARTAADRESVGLHVAAPITLASLSALLFVEAAWLRTPLTESWAVAALIMSASSLLPVGPLDGAQLGKRGVIAATGVVGGALLVTLGLI